MSKKLRLKEMSHKKLRKLAKELTKELQKVDAQRAEAVRQSAVHKDREISWKAQFDAEVHYKKKYCQELTRVEGELSRYEMQCKRHAKRIEELEHALDALGYETKGEFIESMSELGKKYDPKYIGEMPDDLQMGVDGQLREEDNCIGHQPFDTPLLDITQLTQDQAHSHYCNNTPVLYKGKQYEIEAFESDKDDTGFKVTLALSSNFKIKRFFYKEEDKRKVDLVGSLFGVPQGNDIIPKSADVDAAVEWAKRNGHHQPEGNPEPNKMEGVRIKSADEISAENIEKHTEIVCNEIANDKSRLLDDIGGHPRLP